MNCSELREHYELYALGLAEDAERDEIRAHLNRGCEACMRGLKGAREMIALVGVSGQPMAPSPKLRKRILASVGVGPNTFGWIPALAGVAALAICAAVYFSGREKEFSQEAAALRNLNRTQNIELTRLNEAFAILNGADTTVTSFGEKTPKPKGRVFVNPSQGILLIASSLPAAPEGKAYEMWLIPKGGKPVRAGMFRPEADGTAMHIERRSVDVWTTAAVAVTLEVAEGVDAPTNTPLIVAALPALQ